MLRPYTHAVVLVAAAVSLICAAPAAAQAPVLSTYPVPGMNTATTRTQLSFRGAPREALGTIVVDGSRSGRHRGTLRAHSDGNGASFVPDRPFGPGERVRVRTRLRIQGAKDGDYSFDVGRRPPLPRTRPAELATVGNGEVQRFATRLDLVPPAVTVTAREEGRAPGFVFLAPKSGRGHDGPMIIDDFGRPVWFKPIPNRELATDFRVQSYGGRPVLTWWQGRLSGGDGRGEGVIYDDTYRAVRRVRMGNGLYADLHEFELTPQGTALLIAYDAVRRSEGIVLQAVVQEIDVATGLVLFEWHSLGNIALSETHTERPSRRARWDYMHLNSVALDGHGDFIVSARATDAVYRISRVTGRVVWRLGGKRSDFKLGPGASFSLQHDARPQPDGSLTIFDNSRRGTREASRGITVVVDERRKTATLRQAVAHPTGVLSSTQGGVQALPGGNVFVGWGSQRFFSEYDAQGRLVFAGQLARGNDNYRAYRFPWTGRPASPPKALAERRGDRIAVQVSWNGSTNVARWQMLAGRSANALAPVTSAAREEFETAFTGGTRGPFVAVRALDAAGVEVGRSATLRVR